MDRTTKLLLFAIAAGLWMNVFASFLHPVPVEAQATAELYIADIQSDLRKIAKGTCTNSKIC